jgi:hypothetical protein
MKSNYRKCISCGKYFLISSENDKYCSIECKKLFVRCSVCGNYYQKKDNIVDINNYICSVECSKRFKIKKSQKSQKLDFSNL